MEHWTTVFTLQRRLDIITLLLQCSTTTMITAAGIYSGLCCFGYGCPHLNLGYLLLDREKSPYLALLGVSISRHLQSTTSPSLDVLLNAHLHEPLLTVD